MLWVNNLPHHNNKVSQIWFILYTKNYKTINHIYLISCGFELDPGAGPDNNESVEKVGLDASRWERSVVCLQKHHTHYIVANVSFPLQLLMRKKKKVEFITM